MTTVLIEKSFLYVGKSLKHEYPHVGLSTSAFLHALRHDSEFMLKSSSLFVVRNSIYDTSWHAQKAGAPISKVYV